MIVPFNRAPYLPEIESAVEAAIRAGALSSNEPFASKVDDHLSRLYGCKVITLSSATHALEAMALLLGISPGDEVVVPSFAFVSTASAFSARGAYIRFVDCDERGNVCPDHLERVVSQKTKAVVVIHYGGTSAPMERILEICSKHRVPVLEDAAQALGVSRNGVPAGTFGDLGCISFQSNKVIASGEGGALIVNHEKWLERAQQIRDKGTNRLQHLNGTASQYTWLEQGSNYGFPGLCAAALLPQLQLLESILQQRRTLWRRYEEALAPTLDRYGIQVIKPTPHETATNAAQFSLLFPGPPARDQFLRKMRAAGVHASFHFVPLHLSPFAKTHFKHQDRLPGSERIAARIVRLPLFYNLSKAEQDHVIEVVERELKSAQHEQ